MPNLWRYSRHVQVLLEYLRLRDADNGANGAWQQLAGLADRLAAARAAAAMPAAVLDAMAADLALWLARGAALGQSANVGI